MNYQINILRRAQKELGNLQQEDYERIRDTIRKLAKEPRPRGCKKLVGREGWRVRVGNYRLIYEINDEQENVTILSVGHRRNIYR